MRIGDLALLAAGSATVAVRRISPEVACALTIAALAATQHVGTSRSSAAALALLLDFYLLGRRCDHLWRAVLAAGLLVAPVAVLVSGPEGSSVFDVAASWVFGCALPFAAGRTIDHHEAVTVSLRAWTGRLAREQKEHVAQATGLERARVARELHDVIAHNVSVMVIQAVAARRIAPSDRAGAAKALDMVEACGRDAVREMRRLVGVLRRDDLDSLHVPSQGGVDDLGLLAERARSAGLDVTVRVEGKGVRLPPALDLTARRVLQEALTNAIRYAAPASAVVTATYGESHLELDVRDSGRGRAADGAAVLPTGGKGLIGMRERVVACGGELTAGPVAGGGFRVHARLPLRAGSSPGEQPPPAGPRPAVRRLLLRRWFDPVLAGLLFVACEAQLLASWHHRGSLVAETAILLGLTAPVAARRWAPVAAAGLVMAFLLLAAATPLNVISPDAMLFVLLIPPYSAGAYARRGPAAAGLATCLAAWLVLIATTTVGTVAWEVLSTGLIVAAWSTGRAIRARRSVARDLGRAAAAISAEAGDLARLAVADERTRIARQLQAAVARSVADMVIQTHAARVLLDGDPAAADAAMAEIDLTGRRALDEMRAMLGILRGGDAEPSLAPQPGVGRLPALVSSARNDGWDVELRVDGEPRPLPALCDLGVYRIAEEALRTVAASSRRAPVTAALTLTFGEAGIALDVRAAGAPGVRWPTPLMAERAELSGGTIECGSTDFGACWLRLELRTVPEEALL